MFSTLSDRLGAIFDGLRKRGALKEEDVDAALRAIRVALLEADVALPVVKDFVAAVREKAIGQEVIRSVTPGQMVVKIVHDHLVSMLGDDVTEINLNAAPPATFLLVGLQGAGKTTTAAKLGFYLNNKARKRVLLASLDTSRPAAQEQLKILGEQAGLDSLPIIAGQQPLQIAKRAMNMGRLQGYDIILLDTAGRLSIDAALMQEVTAVRDATNPLETLLIADAMTGQDAVITADNFQQQIGLTGIILTRVDGDARGGAALSMRAVTGCPIKMIGMGEKLETLEIFHPDRIAGRILGMGDVVSLVERATETFEEEEAELLAQKMRKGMFTLDDMAVQFKQMRKMGGMDGLLGMLPGIGKIKAQLGKAKIDDNQLRQQQAILSSMTKAERSNAKLIAASRKRRIAIGSGTSVQDVNRVLKQHKQMQDMMKKVGKMDRKGLMRHGFDGLLGGGVRPF